MENITLGQIVAGISILAAIGGFITTIFHIYKKNILDKFNEFNKRIGRLEERCDMQDKEILESKAERLILLRAQLACLKGLHDDLNCNGPVTQGIKDIEEYLLNMSHK